MGGSWFWADRVDFPAATDQPSLLVWGIQEIHRRNLRFAPIFLELTGDSEID